MADKIITIIHADVRCRINNFISAADGYKMRDALLHHIAISVMYYIQRCLSDAKPIAGF
jgi:hypothetical protein